MDKRTLKAVLPRLFGLGKRSNVRNGGKRDILYLTLARAMDLRGCPICQLVRTAEEKALCSLLYEHVNDPSIREKLRKGLGLCTYHAWLMVKAASSNPLLGGLGPAIIYEDVLSHYLKEALSGKVKRPSEGGCYLCELARSYEEVYLGALVDRVDSTDLIELYGFSFNLML